MQRFGMSVLTALTALALTAAGTEAQRSSAITISRGSFAVVPYGGYLLTQNFIDGPLNSSVGAVSAPMFGVQASLPLAPSASVVGTVGYASGDLEVGVPLLGGISIGNTSALVLDASVELRATNLAERFVPLVQFGGGVLRRELTVAGVSADATNFQVSGGIGADIPITSNIALRLLAKDHYGKSDFGSLGEFTAATKDLHNVALMAGLNIYF